MIISEELICILLIILPRIAFDTVFFEKACYNKCLKDMRICCCVWVLIDEDYMCYGEHSAVVK